MNTTHTQQFNENFRKRWTTEEEIIVELPENIKNFESDVELARKLSGAPRRNPRRN